ncbi:MAG: hypothetical protein GY845_10840 [Planctomycetes bacterium]|nr:hypothetical protein [Planctomycetota bacterium]
MQRRNFIRLIFFVVFFSIGASSLGISILCDDLVKYYRSKNDLVVGQQAVDKLKSMNADYDVLLEKWEEDPNNMAKRLAPATLGTKPEDPNTVYPKAIPEELAKAHEALAKDPNDQSEVPMLPNWLTRCSEPRRRTTLFIAGSFLILISFTCFAPVKQPSEKKKR